jgi:hypothetical protein
MVKNGQYFICHAFSITLKNTARSPSGMSHQTPASRARANETIFRNIIRDMKSRSRGIIVPEEINPDSALDELIFLCCANARTKIFGVIDFNLGPSQEGTEQVLDNEVYIEVQNQIPGSQTGATLIYEIGPNGSVGYCREYNRWQGNQNCKCI